MGSWNTYISSETQSYSRKLKLEQPRLFSSRSSKCLAVIAAVPFNGAAWAATVFKQKLNGLIQLLHITGQDHGPEDEVHGQYILGKWQVTSWRSRKKIQDDTRFPSDLSLDLRMTVSKCQKLSEGSESSEKEQLPQYQQERVVTSSLLLLQHGKETTPDTFKRVDTQPQVVCVKN